MFEANELLSEDRGLHIRIDPEKVHPFYGDFDPKEGDPIPFENFRDALTSFMESEYHIKINPNDYLYTKNVEKEGSYHLSIPSLKARASKLKEIMKHFKKKCPHFSKYIDTIIYSSHIFRLPNQTCDLKNGRKTRHEVVIGELKDFIQIPSDSSKNIDDIKSQSEKPVELPQEIDIPYTEEAQSDEEDDDQSEEEDGEESQLEEKRNIDALIEEK